MCWWTMFAVAHMHYYIYFGFRSVICTKNQKPYTTKDKSGDKQLP